MGGNKKENEKVSETDLNSLNQAGRGRLKEMVPFPEGADIEPQSPAGRGEKLPDLFLKLARATRGLIYISETDSEVFPFYGGKSEVLDGRSFPTQIDADPDVKVEERDFDLFFENMITMQNWFDDESVAKTKQYKGLKDLLCENLQNIRVFVLGKINVDIYIVGLDRDRNLLGVKTSAVET